MSKKEKKEKSPKINPKVEINPLPEKEEKIHSHQPPEEEKLKEKEQKIVQLENQLQELKKWKEENLSKIAHQLNQLQKLEEWRKREIKENEKYGKQALLTKIIEFVANLENRVVKGMRDYPDSQGIVLSHAEGIEANLENLKKDLEKEGVREIPIQIGVDLRNSLFHESLKQVSSKKPPGTILEVYEKGYLLHDRVIRTAKVKTSKE